MSVRSLALGFALVASPALAQKPAARPLEPKALLERCLATNPWTPEGRAEQSAQLWSEQLLPGQHQPDAA